MKVMEENKKSLLVDDEMYIAVGKVLKDSKSTLLWSLKIRKESGGQKIGLIFVHQPEKYIPMPMGGKFPASQVGEVELKAFREHERQEMHRILDDYRQLCAQFGVCAEIIHIKADSIQKGIVELISQHRILHLVMGAAADGKRWRKMVKPKSKKANYVCQHAPNFCRIWFMHKDCLIYAREPTMLDVEERLPNSCRNMTKISSEELNSESELSDSGGYGSKFNELSAVSISSSSKHSLDCDSFCSLRCLSFESEATIGLELVPQLQNPNKHQDLSPPSVSKSYTSDDVVDELQQAMSSEDSMKRMKVEREAREAMLKAKETKNIYNQAFRQRKEREEELEKRKNDLTFAKNCQDNVAKELYEALDHQKSLEGQIETSDLAKKELEKKILFVVELLQKYKEERDSLQAQRDSNLREASELRKLLGGPSDIPMLSEFSFFDLEKAANKFDPSLKIGEGGYGSIYKGLLRHTEVAIKILNPYNKQGPAEFQQEVNILSKLRHQNLVTLIGACPDSWALVYEYVKGGSLEDRLNCKDNSPPLQWHTRIRIASELCSALVFLHSSRPSRVVHGDLKPANILLDDNLVSKLSDFGICYVLSIDDMTAEQTMRSSGTEVKGTLTYMDPEFLLSGDITVNYDVYSFGVILLRLLTGRSAFGIIKEVQYALDKGNLNNILDPSAGDWPFVQTEQLARIALRCCDANRKNRPELETEVRCILEQMKASRGSLTTLHLAVEHQVPHYFVCPLFEKVMQDPHIAADGITYEAEAIKG